MLYDVDSVCRGGIWIVISLGGISCIRHGGEGPPAVKATNLETPWILLVAAQNISSPMIGTMFTQQGARE